MKFAFDQVFTVDFDKGLLFWKEPPKNHLQRKGDLAGFICIGKGKNKSYWHIRAFGRTFKRARILFYMAHGRWPSPVLDHINGDALDDRLCNLRECTRAQNAANSKPRRNRTHLPKGVTAHEGKYRARLTVDGRTRLLGVFETADKAQKAYEQARRESYGEFAPRD